MKIVILDGHTANPGDLSWAPIQALGQLKVYPRTPHDDIIARAIDADIVLTNKTVLSARTISQLPNLKHIGVMATGVNVVDLDAAHTRGITVSNVPGYSTQSVAQTTFALLLAITNRTEHYAQANRSGKWSRCPDFSYTDTPLIELNGKTMGVIGMGAIGAQVANIAQAFGMTVITPSSKPADQLPAGVIKTDLDTLLAQSHVITLHCPLTDTNRHLINAQTIAKMRPGAILINTARGPLVDENALAQALADGHLYAAGLDVMTQEPPHPDNPLLRLPNCFTTPHIAWATAEARERLISQVALNVEAFINGQQRNNV